MQIVITIPKYPGMATMQVDGVQGPVCLKRTEALRQKLAASGKGLTRKKEFDIEAHVCLGG